MLNLGHVRCKEVESLLSIVQSHLVEPSHGLMGYKQSPSHQMPNRTRGAEAAYSEGHWIVVNRTQGRDEGAQSHKGGENSREARVPPVDKAVEGLEATVEPDEAILEIVHPGGDGLVAHDDHSLHQLI